MNLINLPMDTSATVRKMLKDVGTGTAANPKPKPKASSRPDVNLVVKKELSGLSSLDIKLKPGEVKKLQQTDPSAEQEAEGVDVSASGAQVHPEEPPTKRQRTGSGPGGAKGKVQQKKCQFKPFEEDEKKAFRSTVDFASGESRPLTALDDCIQALDFVLVKLVKSGVVAEKDVNSERLLGTYGFCVSLFLEFCWQTKVAVNGKEHRQYSTLRGDLQATFISTNEEIECPESLAAQLNSKASKDGKASTKALTPLEIAELLCQSFLNKPVTAVIWDTDDPDEQVLKNIAHGMSAKKLGEPITAFVKSNLHLPLSMHSAVQNGMRQVWGMPGDQLLLPDVLSVIFAAIDEEVPASWCGFAFDVMTAFADRHHFVEGTEKVFGTSDNLQKFVSLRTKYLLTILKEVLGVKDMRDISADKKAYLISLSSLDFKSRDFDRLIVFDAVQFSRTWAREWNNLLQKTNSFKDLSKYLEDMKNVVTDNENPEEPPASKLSMKSVAGFREAAEGRKEGKDQPGKAAEIEEPPSNGRGNADGEGEGSEQEGQEGRDKKTGRFTSGPALSAEMNVKELNSFRDPDLVNSLSLLEASADSAALKFCLPETDEKDPDPASLASMAMSKSQMNQIFVRVLERKMEVLQWQLFEYLTEQEHLVQISLVGPKKDQVRVSVPVEQDLCLPFAGTISTLESASSGSGLTKSYPFGTLFGLHFHVQPKSMDTQNGDFVIPAWAAKAVTKASDCFFQQKKYTVPMVAVRPSSEASPMDISLHR